MKLNDCQREFLATRLRVNRLYWRGKYKPAQYPGEKWRPLDNELGPKARRSLRSIKSAFGRGTKGLRTNMRYVLGQRFERDTWGRRGPRFRIGDIIGPPEGKTRWEVTSASGGAYRGRLIRDKEGNVIRTSLPYDDEPLWRLYGRNT